MRHEHRLPFGATLLSDGLTSFRLWAPGVDTVELLVDGQPPQAMRREPDGWVALEASCGAGARYLFRLPDGREVPDPASRFQPRDVGGPSEVIDPRAYDWQQEDWIGRPWTEAVIYELHAGTCGGYDGVRERLPDLAELGITAIELMPLADFAGRRNWGYDGVLPFAPDAAYGDPVQLKQLIDAAHAQGIMVLLDVVYNHFGPEGNHLQAYAPQFFRGDRQTPWGAAIDFRRPEVRSFYVENALYWLEEYRFDGLRFDAVHAIQDPDFVDELGALLRQRVGAARHIHLVLENERNEARHLQGSFSAQWNDDIHNAIHVMLTGESEGYYANYADDPAAQLARCLAEGFAYQGQPSPSHGGAPRGSDSRGLPPYSFVFFLQNHDQIGNRALGERLSVLAHPESLRAAIALQLLSPQIPLLFMGEEWGSRSPFLFFTDFQGPLAEAVREGRRREFAAFSAFRSDKARAAIPDPNDEATFRRSIADPAEASDPAQRARRLEVGRLLALRRDRLMPRLHGSRSTGAQRLSAGAVHASWRLGDGAALQAWVNLHEDPVAVPPQAGMLLYGTAPDLATAMAAGELPGRRCAVYLQEPA